MNSRKPISKKMRLYIIWRDGGRCRHCNRFALIRHPEIDHVIPVSRGGDNYSSNLVLACRSCNRSKGSAIWTPLPLGTWGMIRSFIWIVNWLIGD